MLTFSDLRDTELILRVTVRLEILGDAQGEIHIGDYRGCLRSVTQADVSASCPFDIRVMHHSKTYQEYQEVAVVITEVRVGSWCMMPEHNHLAHYANDRDGHPHARYLGFNGEWCLSVDQPFWLWHHDNTGQGMLIQPVRQESRQNS